jgi:exodeoxyribonuclease VII large subunit
VLYRAERDARRRLDGVRLSHALIQRPLADARSRLAALARLASQLHPEKPLERGYAIVRGADGNALTSRAQATAEALLALQFRDGRLDAVPVATGAAPSAMASRTRKPKPSANPDAQEDLFD